jgi:AraC family transcriptional regulator of adaptative response / DNA-3-methyladenine glycosylase II
MDDEQRYQAAASKDARFDGMFFTAVRTTGIYCRPSCPALTPKRSNVVFYPTAAAAQRGGYRACKRCRPDASPGSPEWNVRCDVAGRAMRLIIDGVVDREGIPGLAARLGYSPRQIGRVLAAELGAGPLALARAQRARTARVLIETTTLPFGDIAFAAGFASIRQFNATMLEVYDVSPSLLRERAARRAAPGSAPAWAGTGFAGGGTAPARTGAHADAGQASPVIVRVRLPFRPPIDLGRMFGYLAARAVPGVEVATPGEYKRTIALPNGCGLLALRPVPGQSWVDCTLVLADLRDVTAAVQRCRRLLDLDADPLASYGYFAGDPVIGPLAAACPGRRSVGAVDGDEIAVRAVLGQQVSIAAGRTLALALTRLCGTALPANLTGDGFSAGLTHVFPSAAAIAALDPAVLPMPAARARALTGLAAALAAGDITLDPGADRDAQTQRLLRLPGIGPWTAGYIRMRGLSDPDVFLPGDVGVLRAVASADGVRGHAGPGGRGGLGDARGPGGLGRLGDTGGLARGKARLSAELTALADNWRPWRSYAVHQLWASLELSGPEASWPETSVREPAVREPAGPADERSPAAPKNSADGAPIVVDYGIKEEILS